MVVHYWNKHLVVLIPKLDIGLVGVEPSNIDDDKHYKEVWDEDLEVSEILHVDKGSCEDEDSHHANEWLQYGTFISSGRQVFVNGT